MGLSLASDIRNVTGGRAPETYGSNSPYPGGLQKQYFADATKAFYKDKARFGTALYEGQMQGVNYADFYAWTPVRIRTADVIDPTTGQSLTNDWQNILLENTNIDTIPQGVYLTYNSNTWIMVNSNDVGQVTGTGVVRRCNATWNTLDWYGNVVKVPFVWDKLTTLATGNVKSEHMLNMGDYQNCAMQYNPVSAVVEHNTRFILGKEAYMVSGLQNFAQDYTGNTSSSHLMTFTLHKTEPNATDDLTRGVAGGNEFSWSIQVAGSRQMSAGMSQALTASSKRNGITVTGSDTYPIGYTWETSDSTVATVDANGTVTAVGHGECIITCILMQNASVTQTFPLTVITAPAAQVVLTGVPDTLEQTSSAVLTAGYWEAGERTESIVTFTCSGPDASCYGVSVSGNNLTLTCYKPSSLPLTVTASFAGQTASADIQLEGY